MLQDLFFKEIQVDLQNSKQYGKLLKRFMLLFSLSVKALGI